MALEIVYEDSEIAVCVKPAGVSSEHAGAASGVPDLLQAHFREKPEPDSVLDSVSDSVFTVHRLDRDVSGLMVYARTKNAAASLSEQIRLGTFRKEYAALVCGKTSRGLPEEGELRDLLFRDSAKNKVYPVKRMRKGVREAVLRYKTDPRELRAADGTDVTLTHVILVTGRTHQIRVQFASRRFPLLGDAKYGSKTRSGTGGIALMAVRLGFDHPVTGKRMEFEREFPVEEFLKG